MQSVTIHATPCTYPAKTDVQNIRVSKRLTNLVNNLSIRARRRGTVGRREHGVERRVRERFDNRAYFHVGFGFLREIQGFSEGFLCCGRFLEVYGNEEQCVLYYGNKEPTKYFMCLRTVCYTPLHIPPPNITTTSLFLTNRDRSKAFLGASYVVAGFLKSARLAVKNIL